MSDFVHAKVIRLKITPEDKISDIWDLEDTFPEEYQERNHLKDKKGYLEISPTEERFLDFVLYYEYGADTGDFGIARYLSDSEIDKYLPIFQRVIPTAKKENLRFVEYSFYNCTECESYFEVQEY